MKRGLELGFCILGIYVCFLTWGVLQERLSSSQYAAPFTGWDESGSWWSHFSWLYEQLMTWLHHGFVLTVSTVYDVSGIAYRIVSPKFESFVLLNMVQSIGSVIVSFLMLVILENHWPMWTDFLSTTRKSGRHLSGALLFQYARLALCFCLASPFGYASLQYIDYVAMNLGKSCKLLPLVIISIFFRGKRIDSTKLFALFLITAGVTGFMLFDGQAASKKSSSSSLTADWLTSFYGLGLLLINLMLDGAMNTFQDEVFSQFHVTSFHMMFHMNWISVLMMLVYLVSPITGELWRTLDSLILYPRLFADVCLFGVCGALGQAFVFYTIQKFGAISLVTVTVTRKLFTILLSVAYFGHSLNILQWLSVAVVFAALLLETFSKHKKRIVPKALLVEATDRLSDTSISSFDLDLKKED